MLLRGIILLFTPPAVMEAFVHAFLTRDLLYVSGAASFIVGAFMTYAGFRAPPILSVRP